jgi:hypothetical protein
MRSARRRSVRARAMRERERDRDRETERDRQTETESEREREGSFGFISEIGCFAIIRGETRLFLAASEGGRTAHLPVFGGGQSLECALLGESLRAFEEKGARRTMLRRRFEEETQRQRQGSVSMR